MLKRVLFSGGVVCDISRLCLCGGNPPPRGAMAHVWSKTNRAAKEKSGSSANEGGAGAGATSSGPGGGSKQPNLVFG